MSHSEWSAGWMQLCSFQFIWLKGKCVYTGWRGLSEYVCRFHHWIHKRFHVFRVLKVSLTHFNRHWWMCQLFSPKKEMQCDLITDVWIAIRNVWGSLFQFFSDIHETGNHNKVIIFSSMQLFQQVFVGVG